MPHRVLLIQRDTRIQAVYADTLAQWKPTTVGTPAELQAAHTQPWDGVVVSSPIGTLRVWELARQWVDQLPGGAGRVVVIAAGDPPPEAPQVLHLQPFCTREDIVKAMTAAVEGVARPLPGGPRHALRWVVPETYEEAVERARDLHES